MIRSRLEIAFSEFLREKKLPFLLHGLRACLVPLSYLYSFCIRTRNFLFDVQILKQKRCSLPIVSVGNIVAGGTGKTPVTLLLAETLASFCRVAILTRGYRSVAEKGKIPLLLSTGTGAGPRYPANICGDEAFLLASRLPEVMVLVGKNRFKAAEQAKKIGAELLLLDDGMQHRQVYRDIELTVMNGFNPFGENYFLPRGFLRDDPKRLKKADLIIITGQDVDLSSSSCVPTVKMVLKPLEVLNAEGESLPSLKGMNVALFCGIAEPSRFVETLRGLGACVVDRLFLADHERVCEDQLFRFLRCAKQKGAQWAVCTEKDWVKLNNKTIKKGPLPLAWVKSQLIIERDSYEWEAVIERIKKLVKT